MPQGFSVFRYLTVISKGTSGTPALASTHMETNITHLTPPCKPGGNKCLASSFIIPSGTGFWGQISKGWEQSEWEAVVPRPIDWNPAPLPSVPYFLPFSLSFSARSCLSVFLAISSSLTSLFSHPPKWPPKNSCGFQSFCNAKFQNIKIKEMLLSKQRWMFSLALWSFITRDQIFLPSRREGACIHWVQS